MSTPRQHCGDCRYLNKCYSQRTSVRNVILNIIACRIRLDIERNESSKLLLQMIRPNLLRLISEAKSRAGSGYIDTDTLLMDLESRVVECLLSDSGYKIGGNSYLTAYLFSTNPRMGWVRKWILWNFSKHQRFYHKHMLYGDNPSSDTEEEISEADRGALLEQEALSMPDIDSETNSAVESIMNIVNDGVTLNTNEYRVISFCLAHANESNKARLIDGTHTYLSGVMGVSRPRITRIFCVSKQRIKKEVQSRGIDVGLS